MSYGAAAAASAAQVDTRASAVFNLDGTQHLSDLFGVDIRVPLLTLTTEPAPLGFPYTNEFFYESLETMGDRQDIAGHRPIPNANAGSIWPRASRRAAGSRIAPGRTRWSTAAGLR